MDEGPEHQDSILETVRVREVVGVVHSQEELDAVTDRLTRAGFDRSDIDLMASRDTVLRKLNAVYADPTVVADVPDVPRRDLVMRDDVVASSALVFGTLIAIGSLGAALPIIASGGAVAAAVAAAVAGGAAATAIAKPIRDHIVGQADAKQLEDELRLGGLVVFVRVRSPEREAEALAIMRDCGARNVHVHEVNLNRKLDDIPLAKIARDPWLENDRIGG